MTTIRELIKVAEAQTTLPKSTPMKSTYIKTADIEKFASYCTNVGNLLKLGQGAEGPQGPGPVVTVPPTGEQPPVDDESTAHDPTESTLEGAGEIHVDPAIKGPQEPVENATKISSIIYRIKKIAETGQIGLPPSDGTQEPGNVGYDAPPDQTGLPENPEGVHLTNAGDVEQANVVNPMQSLFEEHLETAADQMQQALPIATKETEAPTPELPSTALKQAEYKMGKVAAHSFMQELKTIYEGGSR